METSMARRQQQAGGSAVVASNFRRLAETFPLGTAPFRPNGLADPGGTSTVPVSAPEDAPGGAGGATQGAPTQGYQTSPVDYYPAAGSGYPPPPLVGSPPTRYGAGMPPVSDTAPFVAAEVYNKDGLLAVLAIAGGAITFLFPISPGILVGLFLVAFGLAMVTIFRPRQARILAPLYAVTEGLALGGISRYFETSSKGIVPLAILFTGAVFAGTLAAYRAGLVHVNRRFVMGTTVATFGLVVVLLAAWLGVPVPGASGIGPWSVVIGVIYLVVAVANLFVDFSYVQNAEAQGLSAEGEWYAAFSIMLALVMVYIAMLRILGGRR
jgi:uncharacterized YccA/Bax inhibitor family protein